ncbi:MAG: aldehyde dehydrogenase family protein, partial [Actinomycetota bacterium]|nr:aldehyde dehydrogenase family protein [Actinomycetota bacterium]
LELGGCAPFVVLEDADLEHTLEQAMIAKFRNCGQSCVAANVFYVHDNLYEDFVSGLAERVSTLKLGDPLQEETTVGPVINAERREAIEELREQATFAGFEPVASAPSLSEDSGLSLDCFFAPELLATPSYETVDPELLQTEIFGPLVLVAGFPELERLIPALNRNPLGLAGYVFSKDVAKAMQVASRLEVGIGGINEGVASATNVPMGGVKDSGVGREGGHIGMEEFLEPQYLAVRGLPFSA